MRNIHWSNVKCCGVTLLYTVKICHSHWFNKTLIGQIGSIGGTTRLGEFWEEERQKCSYQPDAEETRYECLTEKGYQAMWLNIVKNYGLI